MQQVSVTKSRSGLDDEGDAIVVAGEMCLGRADGFGLI